MATYAVLVVYFRRHISDAPELEEEVDPSSLLVDKCVSSMLAFHPAALSEIQFQRGVAAATSSWLPQLPHASVSSARTLAGAGSSRAFIKALCGMDFRRDVHTCVGHMWIHTFEFACRQMSPSAPLAGGAPNSGASCCWPAS